VGLLAHRTLAALADLSVGSSVHHNPYLMAGLAAGLLARRTML